MQFAYPRVLIVSHAYWEGLAHLPRVLRDAGCEIDLIAPERSFVAHSSWIARYFLAPAALDDAVSFIEQHLRTHDNIYRWVIVGDDPLLYALGRLRHQSWAQAILPCPADDEHIDFMVSKICFLQRCMDARLPVPDSLICESPYALQDAARRFGYPLVIKQEQGSAGQAVTIVNDGRTLMEFPVSRPVIAQRFVEGCVGSAAVAFDKGRLVGFISYLRRRTWGQLGASTAVQFKTFPELENVLHELGRLSGFSGLCGIDFIEQKESGRIFLLEQNFRPTLTIRLGRRVGVDFAKMVASMLAAQPSSAIALQKSSATFTVPLFPGDMLRALDEKDWRGTLKWLCFPHWWRELGWYDRRLLRYNCNYVYDVASDKLRRALVRLMRRITPGNFSF